MKRSSQTVCWAVFVALAFGQLFTPAAFADQADDAYNFAVGLYKQNRWELAAGRFREYLKKHPQHSKVAYARLYLGLTLINVDKHADARKELRLFVAKNPKNQNLAHAMYRVAECSYFLNDLKAARTEFDAFLKKAPEDPLREWAWPYLADTQLRLGDAKAAVPTFEKSLKLFPKSRLVDDAKFGLARSHESLKEFDKAIGLYKSLASNRAGSRAAESQLNLATCYFDSGQPKLAAQAYVDLAKSFPESTLVSAARLNAGYAFYEIKDFRSAVDQFELAAKEPKQALASRYWQGLSLKQLSEFNRAATSLDQALAVVGTNPLAAEIQYYRADVELSRAQAATADSAKLFEQSRQLFLDVEKKWPTSELADDSLHFAAEATLQHASRLSGDARSKLLDSANALVAQFSQKYPTSGLRMYQLLLNGRIENARGGETNLKAAAKLFEQVLKESEIEGTRQQARFQWARTLQRLNDHAQTIVVVEPLVKAVSGDLANSSYSDALVLYATSLYATTKFEAANTTAQQYLDGAANGSQRDEAYSIKARALAELDQRDAAAAALARLQAEHKDSSLVQPTIQQVAEIAYAQRKFDWSSELFTSLVDAGDDSTYYVAALSGLGWTQFEQKKYPEAAANFSTLVSKQPKSELAPEAAFKVGESWERANNASKALTAYSVGFSQFRPSEYGYLCGLQIARIQNRGEQSENSDKSYQALFDAYAEKFPETAKLDEMLDEWAMMNYQAERFDRADAVFRLLVDRTPESPLAFNAQYSLAEGDLIAGKLDGAKAVFAKLEASEKASKEIQENSLFRLLSIHAEQDDWKDVNATALKLRERFADGSYRWDVEFYQGEALLHLNKLEESKKLFVALTKEKANEQVSKLDWYPHVWVLLAEAQLRSKKYDDVAETVKQYEAWDAKSPYLYQAYETLGRSYKNQPIPKFDQARDAFQKAIDAPAGRRTQTAAKCQLFIGDTFFLQKKYEEALLAYLKVYNLYKFPDHQGAALFQAAQCDEFLKDWKDAVRTYERLITEFPKSEYVPNAKLRLKAAQQQSQKTQK
ncbi:MAG: hypothetical protein CMJ78_23680 [Planctomycetaceae bacterium]|nr:hypothetical protein [Planctomycetaceae bacterium]